MGQADNVVATMPPSANHYIANNHKPDTTLPRRSPNIGKRLFDFNTSNAQSKLHPSSHAVSNEAQRLLSNGYLYGRPRVVTEFPARQLPEPPVPSVRFDTAAQKIDKTLHGCENGQIGTPLHSLIRTKSDIGPQMGRALRQLKPNEADGYEDEEEEDEDEEERNWKVRHGWEDEYASGEFLSLLHSSFYMYFTDKRHETCGGPKRSQYQFKEWRMKDRLKTVSAALVICLNIGVDPPDVVKPSPCSKLECWMDPTLSTCGATKTMEQIGRKLQDQYETLSIRTRYKQYLDPSVDEMKKFCVSLRRNAKDERILFHYNGHGVPLPTQSGEIWVFNKNYTQYIPISLHDLVGWLSGPSLYVIDCSHAGNLIHNFPTNIERHQRESLEAKKRDANATVPNFSDSIVLASCTKTETLPTNPNLPADLFTCCLTTPIDIALRFFLIDNPLPTKIPIEELRIPGRLQDRRSPLGELNWIFTAITDTIAWNTIPSPLFKRLFRQDLMVAALFRNFLLAERIMRAHHCHPTSIPALPETHKHPLWHTWDLALEKVVAQLPALFESEAHNGSYEYVHSTFFTEQLSAFEVYLTHDAADQTIPSQLPIVLQVLLSQAHRLRALILLSRFLDLGPWAVNLALTIGIFPYVLKLLQSAAQELKPVMVFIWARILAVDQSCQTDLLKDNGYQYFLNIFDPLSVMPVGNASEHRAMCAFVLATFCKDFRQGQVVCLSPDLIHFCIKHLSDFDNPLLRQWSCLCLSMLWVDFPEAKWLGIRKLVHQRLCELAMDPVPEVRAAMLHALTNFLGIPEVTDQVAQIEETVASNVFVLANDGNPMVRRELVVFFSAFIKRYENKFLVVAYEQLLEEKKNILNPEANVGSDVDRSFFKPVNIFAIKNVRNPGEGISKGTAFASVWKRLLILSADPFPEVRRDAEIVIDYMHGLLLQSPLGSLAENLINDIISLSQKPLPIDNAIAADEAPAQDSTLHTQIALIGRSGYLSMSIKKTASVATSLRNLAFGTHSSTPASDTSSNASPDGSSSKQSTTDQTGSSEASEKPIAPSYCHVDTPVSRGFEPRNMNDNPVIPLQSKFFEWSTEYFREPQMRPNEQDEPGSSDYNQRLWRRVRNERIIAENQPLKTIAGNSKWDEQAGLLNNGSQPIKLCFHQFEDHLVAADDKDGICIWDWEHNIRLNRFLNRNPKGSMISEVRFINEDDQALLMVGSSDGVIKLYRNYDSDSKVEVVTAWRALMDLLPSNKNAGLVFEWLQGQGKALVAGDVKVIKVWNAATEICTLDIPARSGSCISSLTSDQLACNIFVAGFGDGAVRVYDQRLKPNNAMVKVWREHKQWITNVHMQRGGVRELISGSRNGEVKLWDIRMDKSVQTINATKDTLRSLCVHEHAPVMATGSDRHDVKLYNTTGAFLSSVEPYSRSLLHHNRSSAVLATTFHPHKMMLACAALGDNHINLYRCADVRTHTGMGPDDSWRGAGGSIGGGGIAALKASWDDIA